MHVMDGQAGTPLCPVVDVHSHFMPVDLPGRYAGEDGFPRLQAADGPTGEIVAGGSVFRVVRRPCWDVEARLEEMTALGIDLQVISPVPVSLVPNADAQKARNYLQDQNDRLAAASEAGRGRLPALGAVPLQDTDLAIAELERIVKDLGLAGVEIATVTGDLELDSPKLRPFFAAAADLGAAIFVHPVDGNRMSRCDSPLRSVGIGMLADTALATSALLFGGVLEGCPGLRVCLAHGGGSFPWSFPRLSFADRYGRDPEEAGQRAVCLDQLKKTLYVDSLVFDEAHLPILAHHFGLDHVAFGTDYPFVPVEPQSEKDFMGRAVAAGYCSPAEAQAMRGATALAFIGVEPPTGCQEWSARPRGEIRRDGR